MARYLATGKHNKQSINKIPKSKLLKLRYKPIVDMYNMFHTDVHLYRDNVQAKGELYVPRALRQ